MKKDYNNMYPIHIAIEKDKSEIMNILLINMTEENILTIEVESDKLEFFALKYFSFNCLKALLNRN